MGTLSQPPLFAFDKRCSACHLVQPLTSYHKDLSERDGLQRRCKTCQRQYSQERRRKRLPTTTIWDEKQCATCLQVKPSTSFSPLVTGSGGLAHECKACRNLLSRERYASDPATREQARFDHKLRTYGITRDQYEQMLADQKGVCAICGEIPKNKKGFAIDHDHTTQKPRGLLCANCNSGIGYLQDNPDIIRRAVIYLEQHRTVDNRLEIQSKDAKNAGKHP